MKNLVNRNRFKTSAIFAGAALAVSPALLATSASATDTTPDTQTIYSTAFAGGGSANLFGENLDAVAPNANLNLNAPEISAFLNSTPDDELSTNSSGPLTTLGSNASFVYGGGTVSAERTSAFSKGEANSTSGSLTVAGVDVLSATNISASATCNAATGLADLDTNIGSLTVNGAPVTLTPNEYYETTIPVTIDGVTDAELVVNVLAAENNFDYEPGYSAVANVTAGIDLRGTSDLTNEEFTAYLGGVSLADTSCSFEFEAPVYPDPEEEDVLVS